MRTSPPASRMRSAFESRKRRSCAVASARKAFRSRAASAATSPSMSVGFMFIGDPPSRVVLEVGPHPLAQQHRVMALEDPFGGPVSELSDLLVGFHLVQGCVVRD